MPVDVVYFNDADPQPAEGHVVESAPCEEEKKAPVLAEIPAGPAPNEPLEAVIEPAPANEHQSLKSEAMLAGQQRRPPVENNQLFDAMQQVNLKRPNVDSNQGSEGLSQTNKTAMLPQTSLMYAQAVNSATPSLSQNLF